MEQPVAIGLDLAKSVFQVHGVYGDGAVVLRRQLWRSQGLALFGRLRPCVVRLEACPGADHRAPEIGACRPEVRLMPPSCVTPHVKRGKTDAANAEAICEAVMRPSMRVVPVTSAERQAALPDIPDHLDRMLTRLKSTAIRDQLDSLLDGAGRRELTSREALTMLGEPELARTGRAVVRHWSEDNNERRIERSFGLARFPFHRDFARFDFAAQPSIERGQIRDLATGRFTANGEAVLILGPPGVGKTHLAVAIGGEAIVAGDTVTFVPATTLVATLAKA